jgi:hypothetical protein
MERLYIYLTTTENFVHETSMQLFFKELQGTTYELLSMNEVDIEL